MAGGAVLSVFSPAPNAPPEERSIMTKLTAPRGTWSPWFGTQPDLGELGASRGYARDPAMDVDIV